MSTTRQKLALSDNVHPNLDGSPWGWIVIDGTRIRVATFSRYEERKMCRILVDTYNRCQDVAPLIER
jgi:hypothetical protein